MREALRGRRAGQVSEIWATHGALREPWLAEVAASGSGVSTRGVSTGGVSARGVSTRGVKVHMSAPAEIERRCGSGAHQGVCAQAGGYPYVSAKELLTADHGHGSGSGSGLGRGADRGSDPDPDHGSDPDRGSDPDPDHGSDPDRGSDPDHGHNPEPLIVALDEVQDPQNLGSICRTAECAGASGVAICERRAAEVTPAVCKASAGAVEHLRIARVRNLADFLGQAREAGCWCYGASAEATVSYDAPDYGGAGVVLVLGSEGRGLRPRVAGACDELVALPLRGRVGSLNVSAVAAVMMYEILQRRHA